MGAAPPQKAPACARATALYPFLPPKNVSFFTLSHMPRGQPGITPVPRTFGLLQELGPNNTKNFWLQPYLLAAMATSAGTKAFPSATAHSGEVTPPPPPKASPGWYQGTEDPAAILRRSSPPPIQQIYLQSSSHTGARCLEFPTLFRCWTSILMKAANCQVSPL